MTASYGAAAIAQPAEVAEPREEAGASVLMVDVRGELDGAALREALSLRLPAREVVLRDTSPAFTGASYALLEYTAPTLRMTLIQPNGDAFDRTFEAADDQLLRTAAVELTTLLDAVGVGHVTPDRTDVPVPEPAPEPQEPQPEEPEEPEAEPEEPEAEPEPDSEPEPKLEEPEPEQIAFGVSAVPLVGLGIAPTRGSAFLGPGLAIDFLLTAPGGAVFGLEARVLGRREQEFRLTRARFGVVGGYRLRRGAFELVTLGRLFVEPWWLRQEGNSVPLVDAAAEASSRPPLLGLGVRAAPGVVFGEQQRLRLGAVVDIDASLVPDAGGRSVVLSTEPPTGTDPFARLGGAELGLGVDFTVWF